MSVSSTTKITRKSYVELDEEDIVDLFHLHERNVGLCERFLPYDLTSTAVIQVDLSFPNKIVFTVSERFEE